MKRGFTLIELLVVIAIIGLLASIVMASLSTSRNKARDAAIQEEMNNLRSLAELFYTNNNESYDPNATSFGQWSRCDQEAGDGLGGSMLSMDSQINLTLNAILAKDGHANPRYSRCVVFPQEYAIAIVAADQSGISGTDLRYYCLDSTSLKIAPFVAIPSGQNPFAPYSEGTTVRCRAS